MARLRFTMEQIREIEATRAARIAQHPEQANHAMILLLARVIGVGIETADMLVHEILSRPLRDRKAVARYAGLTGSPDESGARRREKGLAKAGNARVRRGMIQLAWRFLMFQKQSALVQWYQRQTADARGGTRKTMIVALARKLLVALWRLVTTGEIPEGVVLRRAAEAPWWSRRPSEIGHLVDNVDDAMPMTVRGGGDPRQAWLARRLREWARRLGASPRVKPVG
jgi:transposase